MLRARALEAFRDVPVARKPVFMRVSAIARVRHDKIVWTSIRPSLQSDRRVMRRPAAAGSRPGRSQGLHLPQKID
jgi:hypothetical protein